MEPEHDGLGGGGEDDVRFGHGADGVVDDLELDLVGLDLPQRFDDGLGRTLGVRLDDELENLVVLGGDGLEKVLERDPRTAALLGFFPGFELALFGEVAGGAFVVDDAEADAGVRNAVQSEHLHRVGRTRFLHALAVLVDQGADAAVEMVAENDVADAQRALADKDGRGRSAGFQTGLDDVALGIAVGIRLELEQVGLEHDHLQELVDAGLGQRRDVAIDRFATPVVGHETLFLELLADLQRIGRRMVALVDGDKDRDLGRLRMAKRFERLRHHAVIGRDDEDDDVGDVRTAGAHGAERRMAGGIKERDRRQFRRTFRMRNHDRVGADVLGDSTGFTGGHVGLADHVEQRGLAVVDMAHDRDNGRTRLEILRLLRGVLLDDDNGSMDDSAALLALLDLEFDAVLGANLDGGGFVHRLGDGREHPDPHQIGDQLERFQTQLFSQIAHGDRRFENDDAGAAREAGPRIRRFGRNRGPLLLLLVTATPGGATLDATGVEARAGGTMLGSARTLRKRGPLGKGRALLARSRGRGRAWRRRPLGATVVSAFGGTLRLRTRRKLDEANLLAQRALGRLRRNDRGGRGRRNFLNRRRGDRRGTRGSFSNNNPRLHNRRSRHRDNGILDNDRGRRSDVLHNHTVRNAGHDSLGFDNRLGGGGWCRGFRHHLQLGHGRRRHRGLDGRRRTAHLFEQVFGRDLVERARWNLRGADAQFLGFDQDGLALDSELFGDFVDPNGHSSISCASADPHGAAARFRRPLHYAGLALP